MSFSFPVILSPDLFQIHQVAAYVAAEIFALEIHKGYRLEAALHGVGNILAEVSSRR